MRATLCSSVTTRMRESLNSLIYSAIPSTQPGSLSVIVNPLIDSTLHSLNRNIYSTETSTQPKHLLNRNIYSTETSTQPKHLFNRNIPTAASSLNSHINSIISFTRPFHQIVASSYHIIHLTASQSPHQRNCLSIQLPLAQPSIELNPLD
jgi:hypothetical protein